MVDSHPLASLSAAASAASMKFDQQATSSSTSASHHFGNHSTPLQQGQYQALPPMRRSRPNSPGSMASRLPSNQSYGVGQGGVGGGMVNSPDSMVESPNVTGSGAGGAGGGGGGGKKRKASQSEKFDGNGTGGGGGGGGNGGTAGDSGSKKRQVVSCGECKRRKIKCSRTHPCLACCKRGEPEACRWDLDAAPPKPDVQPFAISDDLVKLASRVQALERWASSLPNETIGGSVPPPVQDFSLTYYGNKTKKAHQAERGRDGQGGSSTREGTESPSRARTPSVEKEERTGRDHTEDAVVKLESIAFSQRLPDSRYRPVDSLPFFDNIPTTSPAHVPVPSDRRHIGTVPSDADPDLTTARTSIVAAPVSFEGPFSGPSIGLPLVMSAEEFNEARHDELRRIYKILPTKELSFRLVDRYFAEVDWLHNVCYPHIFRSEHERYWEMREGKRGNDVDPMWLACYSMILALSIDGLRCDPPTDPPSREELEQCHPTWWYGCCLRLIELGDAKGRPQIRFIQTVVLIGQWLGFSAAGGQAGRCLSLVAIAMRTAQILGLHQMTSDPAQMPPPDPAWPGGANSIKREGALRLWSLLQFLEYTSATTRFRSYLLDPNQCSTPAVSNVDFDQLSSTDWRIEPQPRSVFTDSSFEYAKSRITSVSREVFGRLLNQPSMFNYDTVLSLDAKFRQTLRDLEISMPLSGATTSSRQWKRLICLEGVHSRLVRLHRPFLLKKDFSRKSTLESGEIVIRNHIEIQKRTNGIWFVYAHSLAAATALFCDLFDAIDHDLPERSIEAKKEVLVSAFEIFSRHDEIKSPHLRQIVATGSKILGGLFMAEEKRRVTRAASALVGGHRNKSHPDERDNSTESFAQVLERLTRELDIPRPLHPSPAPPISQPLPPTSTNPSLPVDQNKTNSSSLSTNNNNNNIYHSTPSSRATTTTDYLVPSTSSSTTVNDPSSYGPSSSSGPFDISFLNPSSSSTVSYPYGTIGGNGGVGGGMVTLPGGTVESYSSDFWKDGLGYVFGIGSGVPLGGGIGGLGGGGIGLDSNGGAGIGGGAGGIGGGGTGFDFWDLSSPVIAGGSGGSGGSSSLDGTMNNSTTAGYPPSQSIGSMSNGENGYGWFGGGGGGGAGNNNGGSEALGDGQGNRRAAEVMMDQLMSAGW